jgi:hypothetical protein
MNWKSFLFTAGAVAAGIIVGQIVLQLADSVLPGNVFG